MRVLAKVGLTITLVTGVAGAVYLGGVSPTSFNEDFALSPTPFIDRIDHSSVTILRDDGLLSSAPERKEAIGSGIIVRAQPGHPLVILTASHVADVLGNEHAGYAHILVHPAQELILRRVRLWYADPALDLALLVTDTIWTGPDLSARLAPRSPQRGERVWVVGAPSGAEWNITTGVISTKVRCANGNGTCYLTDAILYFGNSGGGVYNEQGELVGVADYVKVDPIVDRNGVTHVVVVQGHGGVISWNTIGLFLMEHLPKQ